MRIAWCTPFTRGNAIGRASSLVVEELLRAAEVDVWHPPAAEPIETSALRMTLMGGPADAARLATYDFAVYAMGNNPGEHGAVFEASRRTPGVVVLHDLDLRDFFRGHFLRGSHGVDRYAAAVRRWYGAAGDGAEFPLFEEAVAGAYAVVTHSECAADRVRSVFPGFVRRLPLPYRAHGKLRVPARETLQIPAGRLLAVTVAAGASNERIHAVLEVLAGHPALAAGIFYVVVGHVGPGYRVELLRLVTQYGLERTVVLPADTSEELLSAWLTYADFCIDLRHPNAEAVPSSSVEQLAYGKPSIVLNTGWCAELPEDCVLKVTVERAAEELPNAMKRLAGDPLARRNIGRRALSYVREEFRAAPCARGIMELGAELLHAKPLLAYADRVGREMIRIGITSDQPLVSTVAGHSSALFGAPSAAPANIAVDLTPVLPGGENGGAKVLALALIPLLAEIAPRSRFILLTTQVNHRELAALDAPNVQRFCVNAPGAARGIVESLALRARPLLSHVASPGRLERMAAAYRRFKRTRGGSSFLERLQAEVLFCPFLTSVYADSKTPFVTVIPDLQFHYFPEFFSDAERARLHREFERVARHAARIVCCSNYVRETATKGGAPPGRTVVIHTALQDRFRGGDSARRCEDVIAKRGLVPGEYLLYPANFWPHKNHAALIEAMRLFASRTPDFMLKLVLTGAGGAERDRVFDTVRSAGLSDRIVSAGFVADAELYALLRCALALVFPSLFEGFGIPVVEAMAAGTPVLCSNAASLPEVAGGAALLFDPQDPSSIADAIARVAGDPALRRRLSEAGTLRAASFGSASGMAERYWNTLCEAALLR